MTPSKTVLIVDDEPVLAGSVRRLLAKEGLRVLTAKSHDQAMDVLQRETVDLCLVDLALPGKSGLELIESIRGSDSLKELPLIVHSGFGEQHWKQVAGFHPFRVLQKPVPPEELIWSVREALGMNT